MIQRICQLLKDELLDKHTFQLIIFNIILLLFMMIIGCKEPEITEFVPIEHLRVPYDYDEAVAKLKKYCGGFPTSFGAFGVEDSIFISDVTGDGVEDLCTFVAFGSGMPRSDIVLFDVENDKFYTLDSLEFRGAYGYDYAILSVEEYGVVILEKQFYPKEYPTKYGRLIFKDGKLGMDEFDSESSEYKHAKGNYGNEIDQYLSNDKKFELNLSGVPEDLRYMWMIDSFGQEMPDKNQICKMAIYWYQPAYQDDPMSFLYEYIDFSDNRIVYRSSQTPGMNTTEYNLSEETKTRYLEAIDYQLLTEEVKANNKWNVSIEYENGECYLYNLSYEWTDKENPKRIMLKTLFDSVEMTDVDAFYAGF